MFSKKRYFKNNYIPNHSNIASVLGMSVSTVAVICHTPVTAYVTGSNLVVQDVKKPLPGRIPSAIHSHREAAFVKPRGFFGAQTAASPGYTHTNRCLLPVSRHTFCLGAAHPQLVFTALAALSHPCQ